MAGRKLNAQFFDFLAAVSILPLVFKIQSLRATITDTTLRATLQKHWSFSSFRSIQLPVIKSFIQNKSCLAIMPTGTGKSLCYQLPSLIVDAPILVICPLVSLMLDQCYQATKYGIRALSIHSGMSSVEKAVAYQQFGDGKCDLLFVSPERLEQASFRELLLRTTIAGIVIDEAHCISQWGYDFRPSYLKLHQLSEMKPDAPILALTATATQRGAADIIRLLSVSNMRLIRKDQQRSNLRLHITKLDDKRGYILNHLDRYSATIIYVRSRKHVEVFSDYLQSQGVNAIPYHAGLSKIQREKNQALWFSGHRQCIVATNAFGMGVNKNNVRQVFHYGIPPTIEEYVQEIGRAGRDGQIAECHMLYNQKDISLDRFRERQIIDWQGFIDAISTKSLNVFRQNKLQSLMSKLGLDDTDVHKNRMLNQVKLRGLRTLFERIQQPKLDHFMHMYTYIQLSSCRHVYLSHYFNHEEVSVCHNCDNCINLSSKMLQQLDKAEILSLIRSLHSIKIDDVISKFSSYKRRDVLRAISELYEEELLVCQDHMIYRKDVF